MNETTNTKCTTRRITVVAPAIFECPKCGAEVEIRNEFGKMDCRRCGYHAGSDLASAWMTLCEAIIKAAPAGIELGTCHMAEAPGDGDWIEVTAGSSAEINRWITSHDDLLELVYEFDFDAIEDQLQAAGASAQEADALTDILAEEGWGGREYEQEIPFARMIDWFREARA